MTAFSQAAGRSTRLSGTRAELTGDGQTSRIYDFLVPGRAADHPLAAGAMNAATRHGGGDAGLMDAFTGAMATGNRELILSRPRASLASQRAVFAAERARQNGTSKQSRTRGKQMHHRELAGDRSGETSSVSRS